jgi:hypothetical protein
MTLVCPATTRSQVLRLHAAFDDALAALTR